jgi:hypothetical protein
MPDESVVRSHLPTPTSDHSPLPPTSLVTNVYVDTTDDPVSFVNNTPFRVHLRMTAGESVAQLSYEDYPEFQLEVTLPEPTTDSADDILDPHDTFEFGPPRHEFLSIYHLPV